MEENATAKDGFAPTSCLLKIMHGNLSVLSKTVSTEEGYEHTSNAARLRALTK